MPIVTVQVTREGTTPGADRTTQEQKARIYKGITNLLHEVLGKHPDGNLRGRGVRTGGLGSGRHLRSRIPQEESAEAGLT